MIPPSKIYMPMAMDQLVRLVRTSKRSDLDIVDMGRGSSSFNALDHLKINVSTEELYSCIPYGDITGSIELREKICDHYKSITNKTVSPSQVCITQGATEALIIALGILLEQPGEIVLPENSFPAYPILIKMLGGKCRYIKLTPSYRLDLDDLKSVVNSSTRAIILNTPDNPFGQIATEDEIAFIENLGVPLIFDEVYQSLPLNQGVQIPSGIDYTSEHFLVNSFSKSLGVAGFRLGYLIAPENMSKTVANTKAAISICTSTPSQLIGNALLDEWENLNFLHKTMLQQNWDLLQKLLKKNGMKLVTQPKAGYFANIDVSGYGVTALQVAQYLAEEYRLLTTPDTDFCEAGYDVGTSGFIRLNFACTPRDIHTAIERIDNCLGSLHRYPMTA